MLQIGATNPERVIKGNCNIVIFERLEAIALLRFALLNLKIKAFETNGLLLTN